ncbi:prenyltransferase/squalene oxidase repeat-containing protein [Bremerella sp. JC770]|uniref:prenyltransferase/squalene oxidase repeat-containing protein n=1 Tax=Bremerella sp. JC770 TaxID=3232137 RepID=UPI003457A1DB
MTGDDQSSPNNSPDSSKPGDGKSPGNRGPKKAPISFGGAPTNSDAWNVVPTSPAPISNPNAQPLKTPAAKKTNKAPLTPQPAASPPPKAEGPPTPESSSTNSPPEQKPKPPASAKPAPQAKQSKPKKEQKPAQPAKTKAKPSPRPKPQAPQPVASRDATDKPSEKRRWHPNIPVVKKPTEATPLVEMEASDDEPLVNKIRGLAIHETPAWAVSLVVHFAIVILLALFTVATYQDQVHTVEATYSEELGEQLEHEILVLDTEEFEVDANSGALETLIDSNEMPMPKTLMNVELIGTEAAKLDDQDTPGVDLKARGDGATRRVLLKAYGGNATTEQAVADALDWLKRQQMKDGSWSLKGDYEDGSSIENKVSATAMALLAFQGAGHTDRAGTHAKTVEKGWRYLFRQLDADGSFLQGGSIPNQHRPYTQAQATIALCELYAMTGDPELKPKAQAAINYSLQWQAPEGGWRYTPGVESDLSVTGWFLMALQSARMGKLDVPDEALVNVERFLGTVSSKPMEGQEFALGSRYQYRDSRAEKATPTMTAEGLLCRQYLGWNQDDPRLVQGMDYLLENPIHWDEPDVYYWYYATQVAHHLEGDAWRNWNKDMRQIIPENQLKRGREKGSWDPAGDDNGVKAGRLFMTCLCTYMLEVYYRHLPIYSKHHFTSG